MLHSSQQASVKNFYQLYVAYPPHPPLIWQAWNIEENVNKCFLVTCQVYEIHLYWWMLCQGVDSGCMWSCGDLFYPESILFRSVNVVSVCVCVSETAKTERQDLSLCVYFHQCCSLHASKYMLPTSEHQLCLRGFGWKVSKKGNFSLKHQYPHAGLIKSTLVRQETSNKTQHMETVRLLWFRSSIWALQWI